jgi:glyoxylase-like metal-dependent hydrolase (beta-lactamase superfamily II)
MKVHHLNCGNFEAAGVPLVCHVLLVETHAGLVLIDTGFGMKDIEEPALRIGVVRHFLSPALVFQDTAVQQVEALGFRREEVRHILLTHLDPDHIGGLADFPRAKVHITAAEREGGTLGLTRLERARYRPVQWSHGVEWVEHQPEGESWFGFTAAKELTDITRGLVMIALPGHTRGHAAFAVDAGTHWILHAGDAFYHHGTLDGSKVPAVLRAQEIAVAHDLKRLRDNQARLRALFLENDPKLRIVCAHDPAQYRSLRNPQAEAL